MDYICKKLTPGFKKCITWKTDAVNINYNEGHIYIQKLLIFKISGVLAKFVPCTKKEKVLYIFKRIYETKSDIYNDLGSPQWALASLVFTYLDIFNLQLHHSSSDTWQRLYSSIVGVCFLAMRSCDKIRSFMGSDGEGIVGGTLDTGDSINAFI